MGVEETETSNIVEFKDFEIKLIEKYRELDEKGKHTVNTVLNMEYNRLRKSHLEVVAAHTDDYSEDQIKLMKQDLEEL
ncbi:hypothetical protein D3C73_1418800 [compost metagenome]